MAYNLSATAEILSQQTNIQQQVILEIDGIDIIFGAVQVLEKVRIGDDLTIGQFVIGRTTVTKNSRDYVDLGGTSTNIRQQIEIDRGGVGSVSKFVVKLIDKGQELTRLFSLSATDDGLLGRECDAFLGFKDGAHPEDSIRIFNGSIDNIEFGAGFVKLSIAHPEQLKRREIYQQITTKIDGALDAVTTAVNIESTAGLIEPVDIQRSFIRVDDELIEYTGITGNSLTGVTRGALGTTATTHDDEVDAVSFYRLEGKPIDVALKMMLSGGEEFFSSQSTTRFNQVDPNLVIANSFVIEDTNIQDDLGLTTGDLVTITGASEVSNNVTEKEIIAFTQVSTGTAITLNGVSFINETGSNATASFKSQYRTLTEGVGMTPKNVDVEQHDYLSNLLAAQFPTYALPIEDTVIPKDFIEQEVYFPAGLYQVPRKGRASVAATIPPLSTGRTQFLTEDNVINPQAISPRRTINKDFYNAVVFKYARDPIADKFTAGSITFSARSQAKINTGTKSLKIESTGLEDNALTDSFLTIQARRFIDRFQFGAERFVVEVNYKTGFNVEVADTVFFGSTGLQVTDITTGTRDFAPRLFEVINKDFNVKSGRIRLTLLDTKFGADGRVGVISPSSKLDEGSTQSLLVLKASFGQAQDLQERQKWQNYVGQKIVVHNDDFSFQEEVTLQSLPSSNQKIIEVNPSLSISPPANYIIDIPDYPDTNNIKENAVYKDQFCFWNPQVSATGGTTTTFTVDAGDVNFFFLGAFVRIHNDDFTRDSTLTAIDDDLEITDITGTTLTVDREIGFTVQSGDKIELIGFTDQGDPYRVF